MSSDYPTSLDNFAVVDSSTWIYPSHIVDLQQAIVALETKLGIDSSTDPNSVDYLIKNFISSGRSLYLYENGPAPTGWSIVSQTDKVLAVKGGSTYTTGGASAGTWGHYHSVTSHNHSLNGVGHTHGIGNRSQGGAIQCWGGPNSDSHDHGFNTSSSAPNTGSDATRFMAAVGIIVIKG